MRVAFTIDGPPVYKDRPRVHTFTGAPVIHASPRNVKDERRIADIARRAFGDRDPWTGPVRLTVTAIFALPQSWPKRYRDAIAAGATVYHDQKPDKDNIEKLVMDGCNGILWRDDSQVAIGALLKRYGAPERIEVVAELIVDDLGNAPLPTPSQIRAEKIPWSVVVRAKEDTKRRRKEAREAQKAEFGGKVASGARRKPQRK